MAKKLNKLSARVVMKTRFFTSIVPHASALLFGKIVGKIKGWVTRKNTQAAYALQKIETLRDEFMITKVAAIIRNFLFP
jgi:hypothetical protein